MGIYLGEEQTTPPTPPSNTWRLYPKSDGWYAKDANGTEYKLVLATNNGQGEITFAAAGSIVLDIDRNDTATDQTFTVRQHADTTPATLFEVHESNGAWFATEVSATAFIDRTPFPETLEIARAALGSMQPLAQRGEHSKVAQQQRQSPASPPASPPASSANGKPTLDHACLHPFVASPSGHRDLSATVSALVRVVQAQMEQLDALQTAVQYLQIRQTGG
jgi:hypothetical protein